MDREGYVHLLRNAYRFHNHLRTFWFKCVSLISLVTSNDPYDNSLYILHNALILTVHPT